MKKIALFTSLIAVGLLISIGQSYATAITGTYITGPDPDNQTVDNGNGTYGMSSTASTYSWVQLNLSQTITFAQLTSLYAVFTDISGGADGGAPRLEVDLSNGWWVNIFLGTSPYYNDSDLNSFTLTYSGFNLIGNNDAGRYDTSNDGIPGGSPYDNYSDALAAVGSLDVVDIAFILDGGWAANGYQSLTLDSIGGAYTPSSVPDQTSTLLLLGFGCFTLAVLGFRQNRLQAAK